MLFMTIKIKEYSLIVNIQHLFLNAKVGFN